MSNNTENKIERSLVPILEIGLSIEIIRQLSSCGLEGDAFIRLIILTGGLVYFTILQLLAFIKFLKDDNK